MSNPHVNDGTQQKPQIQQLTYQQKFFLIKIKNFLKLKTVFVTYLLI